MTLPIEIIEYYDHWEDQSGWVDDHDGDLTPLRCKSIGWVVSEDDRVIRLCANLDENKRGFGAYTILRAAIIKRTVVQP